MALQVWLPLNGNFDNNGVVNITVTPVGGSTTYSESGKIGSCLSCNGSTYWDISGASIGNNASIVWWSKTSSVDRTYMPWVLEATNYSWMLNFYEATYYYLNTGNSTQNPFQTDSGAKIAWMHDGKWHHFAITFDSVTAKLYIDGTYAGKAKTYKNPSSTILRIGGGGGVKGSPTHKYDFIGNLNDFRIYDHCLSAQEVKEISKGLVLHYPLNDIPSNNILTNGQDGATNSSYMIKRYTISSPPANGTLCTVTIKMNKIGAGKTWVGIYNSGGSLTLTRFSVSSSDSEQILQKTFTWRDSSGSITASNTYISTYIGPSSTASESSIAWMKIEVGNTTGSPKSLNPFSHNIIQDCSGYNNNGTVTGTLITSVDTPRYDKCTENTSTGVIMLPTSLFNLKDAITQSYWAYRSDWTTWYSESGGQCSFMSNLESGGIAIIKNTATNIEFIVGTGTTSNSYQYVIINPTLSSGWHHFAITCDGQTLKGYIDGVEVASKSWSTKTPIFYNTSAGYFLFGESESNQTIPSSYTKGKLSDVRIYATALSADDIKDLYQEAAFIDHKGNIGCYQFYEDTDSQITKTGQIQSEEFEEISDLSDGVAKVYEQKIECNQLIEI